MELKKYYIIAVIYPSIITIFGVTILSIIDNYDYESEWLTRDVTIGVPIIVAILYSIFMSLLSLTIFLNKYEKIRSRFFLSFFAWHFPIYLCNSTFIIHEIKLIIYSESGFGISFFYVIIMSLPFMIGLTWSFIIFRNKFYQ